MAQKTRVPWTITGTLLYMLGAALGLWLLVASTWGDLEAMLFDSALKSDEPLKTLSCPVIMTTSDIGAISASFENDTDFDRTVSVQARTSMGHAYLIQEQRDEIQINPGDSYEMEWEVFPIQAAYSRIILARIYQYRAFSIPSRTASCGIVVVDLPQFTGKQVLYGSLAGSFLLMGFGVALRGFRRKYLAHQYSTGSKVTSGMVFLGVLIIVGILVSFLGSWLMSLLMVVLCVITTVGIISFLS